MIQHSSQNNETAKLAPPNNVPPPLPQHLAKLDMIYMKMKRNEFLDSRSLHECFPQ